MAIRIKQHKKPCIDLDGESGNAMHLIASAVRISRRLGMDGELIKGLMMAGSYGRLVCVFNYFFGEYVDLETTNTDIIRQIENTSDDEIARQVILFKITDGKSR